MRTSECAWLRRDAAPPPPPPPPARRTDAAPLVPSRRRAPKPPPGALCAERRLLGQLLRFLWQRVAMPLCRRLFVRGSTQGAGAAAHYWPRGVWLRLRRLALRRAKASCSPPHPCVSHDQ